MGGGKVKTAEDYYNEMKVEPAPLPSLTTDPVKRTGPAYKKFRTGAERRSLLTMGMMNAQQ
jgi:hypothetical protein